MARTASPTPGTLSPADRKPAQLGMSLEVFLVQSLLDSKAGRAAEGRLRFVWN